MTGAELATFAEEVKRGSVHRLNVLPPAFQYLQSACRAATSLDGASLYRYFEEHHHSQHLADSDRSLHNHALQSVLRCVPNHWPVASRIRAKVFAMHLCDRYEPFRTMNYTIFRLTM